MFVEVKTDTRGAAIELRALAELDVLDCRRDPALQARLFRALNSPNGFKYRTEPIDVWTSWAVDDWRKRRLADPEHHRRAPLSRICGIDTGEGVPVRCDCEEFAARGAAAAHFLGAYEVWLCVTQPREHGVAHAYFAVRWVKGGEIVVHDLSVVYGMPKPPAYFYLGPETAAYALREPTPALWVPREER